MLNLIKFAQVRLNYVTSFIPPPQNDDSSNQNVLVVFTHPKGGDSYAGSMLQATLRGLEGNNVRIRRLYHDDKLKQNAENPRNDFRAHLTRKEHLSYFPPNMDIDQRGSLEGLRRLKTAPEVVDAVEDLKWAEAIVFVHPTWWFGFPAALKGWFDRVLLPGVAFRLPSGIGTGGQHERVVGGLVPMLSNIKKVAVVTSYGSDFYTASLLDGSRPWISYVFRGLCAPYCTVQWTALYGMDSVGFEGRQAHLQKIEQTFRGF